MYRVYFLCLLIALLLGCSQEGDQQANHSDHDASLTSETAHLKDSQPSSSDKIDTQLLDSIAQISDDLFTQLNTEVGTLELVSTQLELSTTIETLNQARQEWVQAHNAYIATRLFRQLSNNLGIVHPDLDTVDHLHTNHSKIDQHPLLPGYLDAVEGYPYSGLIHSDLTLSAEALYNEHQLGDPSYVAVGFHALEFMLFGTTKTPREIDQLTINTEESEEEQSIKQRRLVYIKLLGQLLSDDINNLVKAWKNVDGFYLSSLALQSRAKILASLRQIAEVELEACKQIQVILDNQAPTSRQVHDSKESLQARNTVAEKILKLIDETEQ